MNIRISNQAVGEGQPCFIIAEAGVNHNGDVNLARKLIDVAKEAGADAVKFQTFKAEEVVTKSAPKAPYQKKSTGVSESQFEMLKKLELSPKHFEDLFDYARKQEMMFLSSAFDKGSIDLLAEMGVPAFKVASGEITNFSLLKHIAGKQKPIILSTGMAVLGEIEEALKVIREEDVDEIILLHCVSAYPAKTEDMNLKAMATLRYAFGLPVGLSDHTVGITIPIAAVALGACVIEKHFTLDKKLPGPDHRASLAPKELKQMVAAIRDVERAMGNGIKWLTAEEGKNKKAVRRSLVARADIPKGAVITGEMLAIKRPGTGLEPKFLNLVVGRKAKGNIKSGEVINLSKVL